MYLQRRRLIVGAVLFFQYGLVDFSVIEGDGLIEAAALALAFTAICTTIAAFAITVFPSYRQTFEVAGTGLVLLVLAEIVKPDWFSDEVLFQTAWGLIAVCFGYAVLHHVIYGDWWGRFGMTLPQVHSARILIEAPAEDVWRRAVPDATDPGRYYSGVLESYAEVDHPIATNRMRVKMGGGTIQESFVEVSENKPNEAYEMLTWWIDDDVSEEDDHRSLTRITLDERADGTEVRMVERNHAIDVANWIFLWFDNPIEQALYSLRSKVEGGTDPTFFGHLRQQVIEEG